MDNMSIDIRACGKENLKAALMLAFQCSPTGKATHYIIDDGDLVLLWQGGVTESYDLPFTLNVNNAVDFVQSWLDDQKERKEKFDDYEVENEPAFRVFNDGWGHDSQFPHAGFVRIQAIWAWLGK